MKYAPNIILAVIAFALFIFFMAKGAYLPAAIDLAVAALNSGWVFYRFQTDRSKP